MKYINPITNQANELDLENPQPGVYAGVSHEDYLKINAVSRSSLARFRKSPEDYLFGDKDATAALIFGAQYHAFILEPEDFEKSFVAGPETIRSDKNKELRLSLQEEHGLYNVYRPSHLELFKEMRKALKNYPTQRAILFNTPHKEVVAICKHHNTGLMLKVKLDCPNFESGWIIDLKTCRTPLMPKFKWDLSTYGSDLQPGFYTLVCAHIEELRHMRNFEFIAQGKEKPFHVRGWDMKNYIDESFTECQGLLMDLAKWIDGGSKLPDRMQVME